jgi:hypothetical protein
MVVGTFGVWVARGALIHRRDAAGRATRVPEWAADGASWGVRGGANRVRMTASKLAAVNRVRG